MGEGRESAGLHGTGIGQHISNRTRGTGCIQYRATEALGATREPSDEKMSADGNTGGKEDGKTIGTTPNGVR